MNEAPHSQQEHTPLPPVPDAALPPTPAEDTGANAAAPTLPPASAALPDWLQLSNEAQAQRNTSQMHVPGVATGEWVRAEQAADRPSRVQDTDAPTLAPEATVSSGNLWPEIPGYQILGELGKGGMGAVFRGRDATLDREVAVKILRENVGTNPGIVRRFLAEAQIGGQLQHPATVPVYQLGQLTSDMPYFTMKLVEGQTLAKLLKDRSSPKHDLPRFVKIFEQVCQAMAFAHSKSVIHRDLKPLNIMVGAFGEVQVMDWGLAKKLRNADYGLANETHTSDFLDSAIRFPQSEIAQTQAGAILGTPAYMSPEQARGEIDLVDARTDVFALGSMLCEILTGQPAYEGLAAIDVLLRATDADETDAYRRLDDCGADKELIDLAKSCLQAERALRPQDARVVADAVTTHLAGVQQRLHAAEMERAAQEARAEEAWARVAAEQAKTLAERRARRLLASLGLVLLLGLAGIGGLYWRAEQSRAQAEASEAHALGEQQIAQRERDEAEKARNKTRDALDAMTSQVAEDWLMTQKELSSEQKKFLENASNYYHDFVMEVGTDEAGRLRAGEGNFRLATLLERLGRREAAEAAYRQALSIFDKLAADYPAVTKYRSNLASSQNSLGLLLRDLGQRIEAEGAYRQAIAIQKELAAALASTPQYAQDLARTHNNLATLLADQGKRSEAATEYRAAVQTFEKLATEAPRVAKYRQELATAQSNLGVLLKDLGERSEAEALYRRAIAIHEKLAAEFPDAPSYRDDLARGQNNLGPLLKELGKYAEAEAVLRQALAVRERLAADYPTAPKYRLELARNYNNLALLLNELGKRPEAEAIYRQALAARQRLAVDFPAVPVYRMELAASYNNLANFMVRLGKGAEAETAFRQALPILEKLAADFPAVLEYRQNLATNYSNLGVLLKDLGKEPAAEENYRQALQIRTRLVADSPSVPEYRQDLADSCNNLGILLHGQEKNAEAEAVYRQSLALRERLATEHPNVPRYRRNVATSQNNLGALLASMKKRAEAETAYQAALTIRADLASEFPAVPEYRKDVAASYYNFGNLRLDSGDAAQALTWYDKAVAELEPMVETDSSGAAERRSLRSYYVGRARALSRLNRHLDAVDAWDRAITFNVQPRVAILLRAYRAYSFARAGKHAPAFAEANALAAVPDVTAGTLYDLGCVCALASVAVTDDAKLREQYAARAVELLRQAIGKGYKDIERLKKDDDLKALRERSDFQKLLNP